jgi:hypothetical protein
MPATLTVEIPLLAFWDHHRPSKDTAIRLAQECCEKTGQTFFVVEGHDGTGYGLGVYCILSQGQMNVLRLPQEYKVVHCTG